MTNSEKRDLAKTIANFYGFSLVAISNPDTKSEELIFSNENFINLSVGYESDSVLNFSMSFCLPKSIFTLSCPVCSPFDTKGHFSKMLDKFTCYVRPFIRCENFDL